MKEDIQNLLFEEIKSSKLKGITKASQIEVFEPKNIEFGDWTSNICMKLAANSEDSPRQIAEKLIQVSKPAQISRQMLTDDLRAIEMLAFL